MFRRASVRFAPKRGVVIPDPEAKAYDFDRLERVVMALVEQHRRLQRQNAALRDEIEKRNLRLRTLEGQVLEANQRRQDVAKRVDELIAQITQLDEQFSNLDR